LIIQLVSSMKRFKLIRSIMLLPKTRNKVKQFAATAAGLTIVRRCLRRYESDLSEEITKHE
jgi:hypothetical protein